MAGPPSQKYFYHNSGYCKLSRSKNGCKKYHSTEICQINSCTSNTCPQRHPKICKYGVNCMFQTKCSYRHNDKTTYNLQNNNIIKDIESLKAEIALLQEENDKKINILVKVHLRELEKLNKEINTNKEAAVAALEKKMQNLRTQ